MLMDVTGASLTPGNQGEDCEGNGKGEWECCCDECDYLICCTRENWQEHCPSCSEAHCPRHPNLGSNQALSE